MLAKCMDTIRYFELDSLLKRFALFWMNGRHQRDVSLNLYMNRYYTQILPATQKGYIKLNF